MFGSVPVNRTHSHVQRRRRPPPPDELFVDRARGAPRAAAIVYNFVEYWDIYVLIGAVHNAL